MNARREQSRTETLARVAYEASYRALRRSASDLTVYGIASAGEAIAYYKRVSPLAYSAARVSYFNSSLGMLAYGKTRTRNIIPF